MLASSSRPRGTSGEELSFLVKESPTDGRVLVLGTCPRGMLGYHPARHMTCGGCICATTSLDPAGLRSCASIPRPRILILLIKSHQRMALNYSFILSSSCTFAIYTFRFCYIRDWRFVIFSFQVYDGSISCRAGFNQHLL